MGMRLASLIPFQPKQHPQDPQKGRWERCQNEQTATLLSPFWPPPALVFLLEQQKHQQPV